MENKNTILFELQEISPAVANLNRDNVYSIPTGYFDGLPTAILAKMKSQTMFDGVKAILYTTPNGYFTDLAENIMAKIKIENSSSNESFNELESIAPTLNSISKENVYHLPIGYFEGLKTGIPNNQKVKIVSFSKWRKVVSYAAAAVLSGILVTGAFKYVVSKNHLDFKKEVAKSSDEELKQILDNQSTAIYRVTNPGNEEQDEASIFEGTTEEELQQFLKEQPETAEKLNKDI